MKIAIDIMGGDFAPDANISGAIEARKELPEECTIVLLGDEQVILESLRKHNGDPDQFEIVPTVGVVTMNDHPARVISQKPDSSLVKGFKLLAAGEINCFASTGNTGAMLAGSMLVINTIPGVIRPCITSSIPRPDGKHNLVLDVGSNADCKPDVLYQFAILGNIYAKLILGFDKPKVGLLNIGEEEEKGNLLTQSAHKLMKDTDDFHFIGNVESRYIFEDYADVIVCDGFTGNVILKEAEGIFKLIKKRGIEDEYFNKFNYENYGGTPILGINSNVIIGHGISSGKAVKNMLVLSYEVTKNKLSSKIKELFK
ncbi:MAG: phosphate acyltransferase PlsX [Crocinitomicaceae bacterium]